MNESLITLELHSVDHITRFYDYETCRQQSPCYLLLPPPRPPILPKLVLTTSSSMPLTNLPQRMNSFLIILALLITLFSTFALLCYLNFKFQFYDKLQQRYRRRKDFNPSDQPSTISSMISTYNTLTTNQSFSFSLPNKSYQSFPQPSFFDQQIISSNHPMHIYEESNSYYPSYPLTPVYHTYELSPTQIICSNCLYRNLRQQKQCLCEHFFIPIQ